MNALPLLDPYTDLEPADCNYRQALVPGNYKLHINSARIYGQDWYRLVCHTLAKNPEDEDPIDIFIHRLDDREWVTFLNIEFGVMARDFKDPSQHWEGKSFHGLIASELDKTGDTNAIYIHRIKRIHLSTPL